MPIQVTQRENRKLEALNLSYRTMAQSGTPHPYKCEIVDRNSGRVVYSVSGDDEQLIVGQAIAGLTTAHRSMSQSEVVGENERLRRQLLEAGIDPDTGAKQRTDYSELTADELRRELAARGLDAPDGDARTNAWKTKAIEAIKDYDDAAG